MRWFLAHARQEPDETIDGWVMALTPVLQGDGSIIVVVPGRDDYAARAKALGGWMGWCRDVPCGHNYRGVPNFRGIIVPTNLDKPLVGKATTSLVRGFLAQHKHAFAWNTTDRFRQITDVVETGADNWKGWARLIFKKE